MQGKASKYISFSYGKQSLEGDRLWSAVRICYLDRFEAGCKKGDSMYPPRRFRYVILTVLETFIKAVSRGRQA